mmetsp:Transcript_16010/g.44327  ORF Transcript_16010/g.44327 Transcript_16010/m.44327 type:complete len:197 (+) Transcript_16010:164-754(+)
MSIKIIIGEHSDALHDERILVLRRNPCLTAVQRIKRGWHHGAGPPSRRMATISIEPVHSATAAVALQCHALVKSAHGPDTYDHGPLHRRYTIRTDWKVMMWGTRPTTAMRDRAGLGDTCARMTWSPSRHWNVGKSTPRRTGLVDCGMQSCYDREVPGVIPSHQSDQQGGDTQKGIPTFAVAGSLSIQHVQLVYNIT